MATQVELLVRECTILARMAGDLELGKAVNDYWNAECAVKEEDWLVSDEVEKVAALQSHVFDLVKGLAMAPVSKYARMVVARHEWRMGRHDARRMEDLPYVQDIEPWEWQQMWERESFAFTPALLQLLAGDFPERFRPLVPEIALVRCLASHVRSTDAFGNKECCYTFAGGLQVWTDHDACVVHGPGEQRTVHRFPPEWRGSPSDGTGIY